MSETMLRQCRLRRGTTETVAWIEERGAKFGAHVELDGHDGLWQVLSVGNHPMTAAQLAEKQRKDRGSLPSLVPA